MSWGPLQILLILVIVVLLFGTKKLRNLGSDLGSSIKSFKKSMGEDGDKKASSDDKQQTLADKDDVR